MKPEDRKRLKQHIEMIVEHKTPAEELQDENRRLRLELHTLRFKTSQQERFIWWVREVYAKKIQTAILKIKEVCSNDPDSSPAWNGTCAYELPAKCWEDLGRIMESTNGIYNHTDIVDEMSVGVKNTNPDYDNQDYDNRTKTSSDNNKCMWVMVEDPDIDLWCTSCGEEFHLEADTPSDNHMKYCCYCGKEITEGE